MKKERKIEIWTSVLREVNNDDRPKVSTLWAFETAGATPYFLLLPFMKPSPLTILAPGHAIIISVESTEHIVTPYTPLPSLAHARISGLEPVTANPGRSRW